MHSTARLTVTIERATGSAVLRKATWSRRLALADLPRQLAFYRGLWSRRGRKPNEAGPWARFYDDDIRVLEAAIREAGNGGEP